MSIGVLYWLLMIIWLCFGAYVHRGTWSSAFPVGDLLLWVLLAILGYHAFGFPFHG